MRRDRLETPGQTALPGAATGAGRRARSVGEERRAKIGEKRPADWVGTLHIAALLTAAVAALLAIACSPPSAEDLVNEVLRLRNDFDVRLTSWIIRDEGTPQRHLYLDVVVLKPDQASDIDTLTVLVEQVDADSNVVHSGRVSIDVSDIDAGFSQNVPLEVRPVAQGVEGVILRVEPNPPREVWNEFPELDRVRPRADRAVGPVRPRSHAPRPDRAAATPTAVRTPYTPSTTKPGPSFTRNFANAVALDAR